MVYIKKKKKNPFFKKGHWKFNSIYSASIFHIIAEYADYVLGTGIKDTEKNETHKNLLPWNLFTVSYLKFYKG